ncbi:transposase (plasmid) [Croceicoccus marinus]|uniref:Transposase n=1 Tax=Croceicoccus marinus TaxID=450378 RepID=A0A7G6VZU2_9SPHN|nr:transposase [Croceicoccus marinus]
MRAKVAQSTSTLAGQVDSGTFAPIPLYRQIEAHMLAATRLQGSYTTLQVMVKGTSDTARLWVYVCDDRPIAGCDPFY